MIRKPLQNRIQRAAHKAHLLGSALAVIAIIAFASSASALTIVSFDLINPTITPNTGSNTRTDAPGGPFYGDAGGTLLLAFQGDGTTIDNGAVSIAGGLLETFQVTEVGTIIKVTVDIESTFFLGDNDDIGLLSGWNGTSGIISFSVAPDVLNNGTLDCEGTLCGSLGTPPSGTTVTFVNDPVTWAGPMENIALTFNAGNAENPFHFQLAETLYGLDPDTGAEVNFISLEGQGAVVPEPGTGLLVALGLAGMATRRRQK